jgi:hypothetical protein
MKTVKRVAIKMRNGSIYHLGVGYHSKQDIKKNHLLMVGENGIEYVVNINNGLAYKALA